MLSEASPLQANTVFVALELDDRVDHEAWSASYDHSPTTSSGSPQAPLPRPTRGRDRSDHVGPGGPAGQVKAIGRRSVDNTPMPGGTEFTARLRGDRRRRFLVIPDTSHIRLAHAQAHGERLLRRPFNYDHVPQCAGLIPVASMADPRAQFVPSSDGWPSSTFSTSGPPRSVRRFWRYRRGSRKAGKPGRPWG
jgi:hypothetical protein